ncbi:MAG: M16 family metallopeptidase [Flavobacteriaceae bacterium]
MKIQSNILLHLLFILCAMGSLQAQVDRSQPPPDGPPPAMNFKDVHKFQLRNGLTVLLVETRKVPMTYVTLTYDNPIPIEPFGGTIAIMSNMMGKGTQLTDKETFQEEIDFMGASLSFRGPVAIGNSLSKHSERLLEMMAEASLQPKFTAEEFEKAKGQLEQYLEMTDVQASAIRQRVQNILAYGKDHPLGTSPTKESLEEINLKNIQDFYAAEVSPDKAYLVVIGDEELKPLKKKIKKLFGDWKPKDKEVTILPRVKTLKKSQIDFVHMPEVTQSEISVFNTVLLQMKDPDYIAAQMANMILGGGPSSRLFKSIREEKKFTYGVNSSIGDNKYAPGLFQINTSVRNAVTDSTINALLTEIQKMWIARVSEEELANAKAKLTGDFIMALGDPATFARFAINVETQNLPEDYYENYLQKIASITPEDILRASTKYFQVDRSHILVVGNRDQVLDPIKEKVHFGKRQIPIQHFDKYGDKVVYIEPKIPVPDGMTAKGVLNKYLEAIGGRGALDSLQSVTFDYTIVGRPNDTNILPKMIFNDSLSKSMAKVFPGQDVSNVKPSKSGSSSRFLDVTKENLKNVVDTTYHIREIHTSDRYVKIDQASGYLSYKSVISEDISFMKVLIDGKISVFDKKESPDFFKVAILPEVGLLKDNSIRLEPYLKKIRNEEAYGIRVDNPNNPGNYTVYYYSSRTGLKLSEIKFLDISVPGAQRSGYLALERKFESYQNFGKLRFATVLDARMISSSGGIGTSGGLMDDLRLKNVHYNTATDADFE